jgi:apolipoprotein N-acyltransferase
MKIVTVALASAVMFYLSQGLADVWWLAWFAPAPLLWLSYDSTPRWKVFLASLAAFAAGQVYLLQCYWGELPSAALAPQLIVCAAFAASLRLSAAALRRGPAWAALFAFPALWTALEYAFGLLSPHGSFGAIGYAEAPFPAGIQVAALFGVHAVGFLLCLSANAVALLLRRQRAAGGAGAAICAIALIFGFVRLERADGPHVQVAALSDHDTRRAESHERTLASYEAAAQTYAASVDQLKGVQVIAIPEGAVQLEMASAAAILAPLRAAASQSGALVLVGTVTAEPDRNTAFALLPDGTVETYDKRHLLAPLEMAIPGHEPGLLGNGYATQICKDMDFGATVRATAGLGVRLMIVPASDFGRDGWIHARMAIMRGVENGFAVLRSAFGGLITISDAQGRILASAPTTRAGMVAVTASLPLGPGPTLYTRIGDVFSWLCAVLSLVTCAWIGVGAISPSRLPTVVSRASQ